jgi:hypothetical protein
MEDAQKVRAERTRLSDLARQRERQDVVAAREDQVFKQQDYDRKLSIAGPAMEGLSKLPPEQRAAQWGNLRSRFLKQGIISESDGVPEQYDEKFYKDWMQEYEGSKHYLDRQKTLKDMEKTDAEIGKLKREASGRGEMSFNQQMAMWRLEDQRNERRNKAVTKLSEDLSSAQEIADGLGAIETQLGFSLDDWDPKAGRAAKRGADGKPIMEEVDLPGVSVPFLGRVSAHSTDARQLETRVAKVFNTELKSRSGAAVTSPELERLKVEFGSGKFNTESELIGALQDYKRAAEKAMANIELGASPEALAEYQSRGGTTSASMRTGGLLNKAKVAQGGQGVGMGMNEASAGGSAGPIVQTLKPDLKVVDGVEYVKVKGGWEQKPSGRKN